MGQNHSTLISKKEHEKTKSGSFDAKKSENRRGGSCYAIIPTPPSGFRMEYLRSKYRILRLKSWRF